MTVNKVILVGNLGADPEARYLPSGDAIASARLCTNERYRDKASGEYKTVSEWHRVSFFGKLAETIIEYARKGGELYVEGKIRTRKFQAQDGTDRYSTEIVASEMKFLRPAPGSSDRSRDSAPPQGTHRAPEDFDVPF